MGEIIGSKNIRVKVEAKDWKEAIEASGNILLERGKITRKYIDDMIKAVYDMGPYMVLAPGFALAHAKPSSAVIESSVSLVTLANPVDFGSDNDPVKIIMCLASTDNKSHINMLKAVAEKLMDDGMIERIASCQSADEVCSLING